VSDPERNCLNIPRRTFQSRDDERTFGVAPRCGKKRGTVRHQPFIAEFNALCRRHDEQARDVHA
jgi:hypothetical protein